MFTGTPDELKRRETPTPQPEPAEIVYEDDGDYTITISMRLPDHD